MAEHAVCCPDCDEPMEPRMFQDGGFMEGKPAEFTRDWWCSTCRLRWLSVKGEPVEVEG